MTPRSRAGIGCIVMIYNPNSKLNVVYTKNIGVGLATVRSLFLATAGRSSKTNSSEMAGMNGIADVTATRSMAIFWRPCFAIIFSVLSARFSSVILLTLPVPNSLHPL